MAISRAAKTNAEIHYPPSLVDSTLSPHSTFSPVRVRPRRPLSFIPIVTGPRILSMANNRRPGRISQVETSIPRVVKSSISSFYKRHEMPFNTFHPLSFHPIHDLQQKPYHGSRFRPPEVGCHRRRQWILGLERRRVLRPLRFVECSDPLARCSARSFGEAELELPNSRRCSIRGSKLHMFPE